MGMSKQQWFSKMQQLVLAVMALTAATCQAEHECQNPNEITEDFQPVFDFGENWSFQDCGVWSNRDVAAPWRIAVSRTDGATCFGILLSNFDFVTSECKEVADDFRKEPSGVKAYTGKCYDQKVKSTDAPSAECTGLKVNESVAVFGKDSDETQLHLWRLKAAAPDTTPICLFNANQKQKGGYVDSDYTVVDRKWKGRIEAQVGGAPRTSQPSTLCVKIGRSQSTADKHDFSGDFLVKEVRGRMTLRGFFFWPVAEHKIFVYTDVAPFIKQLVANSHNMFIMPDVPPPKTKTDFKKAPTLNKKGECGRVATALLKSTRPTRHVNNATDYVINGNKALRDAYPWHASITNLPAGDDGFDFCGATLISKRAVLTAAHCVYDLYKYGLRASDLKISLGMHDLVQPKAGVEQHIIVESIVMHPEYNPKTKVYDVALLFLKKEVNVTAHVRPICLWDDDYSLDILKNQRGTVVGWGYTEYAKNNSRHRPDILLEGHLSVLDHKECYVQEKVFYRKYLYPGVTFCASGVNGAENKSVAACKGDSGGSFIIRKDNLWYLRGVVSFGLTKYIDHNGQRTPSCNENYPSLYVDLGSCMEWIVQRVAA